MDLRKQLESALGTNCRLIRELGGGGMSRVFLAEDTEHERQIVIKVIPLELAGHVNVERFRREIKVSARLQHPCIVPVLNSGSADGLPYYTMPFVDGESLRSRMARERGLPVQEAMRILHDVSSAVAYAHEHGVVHRDIKPDNILVTKHHAVLADFGVAKALSESTRGGASLTTVGMALGTPAYMAPEQAAADPDTDHRADIYSLGVVAYEMLSGRHPFEGRSPQSMLAAHAVEDPTSVMAHRPQLPAGIGNLVMRMLAKHPGDRPQSAEEILGALDQLPTPTSSEGKPVTASRDRIADRRRKRLIIASGLGGAALTIIAISTFAFKGSFKNVPLPAGNVLLLEPTTGTGATSAAIAAADRILDAVNRGLTMVPTAHVLASNDTSTSSSQRAATLGRRAGAGKVIATSIYPVGGKLQVQFRLIDATSGDIIRTLTPVRITEDPSVQELDSAIDPLLVVVGFAASPLLGSAAIPLRTVPRFAAFKEFETGVNLGVNPDIISAAAAATHLARAFLLDTTFIQARMWEMWMIRSSGAVRNLREAAYRYDTLQAYLLRNRSLMSPFESTMGDFVGDRGSSERVVQSLQKILAINPRNPMRRELPGLLADLNRPYAADSVMASMLAADSSLNSNIGFWMIRVTLRHYTGNFKGALEAARHARKLAPTAIGPLRAELTILAAIGDTAEIEKLLRVVAVAHGRGFFDFAGDLYLSTSQELKAHGHTEPGDRLFKRAETWFDTRTPTDWEDESVAFRGALTYMAAGRLADADRLLKSLLTISPLDLRYHGAYGRLAAIKGDTAGAMRVVRKLADLPAAKFSGTPTFERAQIMAEMNRRNEAISLLQEAFGQGVGFSSYRVRIHAFPNFARMNNYPPFRNLITPNG